MSGHKKKFYDTLEFTEEKVIFWVFVLAIVGYFALQVFLVGSTLGLFERAVFSPRFWSILWEATISAWKYRLAPVFIVLDLAFASLFVYAFLRYWPIAPRVKFSQTRPPTHTRKIRFSKDPAIASHWAAILSRVKSGTQDAMKYSILEADSLVDHFLKKIGFTGEHMADRLVHIVADNVPSLDRVWRAHRLRNELAHTPGMTVTVDQTKEALTAYRDFLIELGAL